MNETLRQFTSAGLLEFSKWLRNGAQGQVPRELLIDVEFSKPMGDAKLSDGTIFNNRYEFGVNLVQLLEPFNRRDISYNRGLWAWLAAWFFDQLCPSNPDGSR